MSYAYTSRAGLLAAILWPGMALATILNDTGITRCASDTQNNLTCPQAGFPHQDAEYGRDARPGLQKVGGGSAGFDFTKLDASGNPLPASAISWDCVRDNVTGLIWEIKTDDNGLRDKDWAYAWYNPDNTINGGDAGSLGGNTCGGTLPGNQCNTQAYTAAVNALASPLCGYTDWRLPTVEELRSIVDYSRLNPAIDDSYSTGYFPPTPSRQYWSASPYAADPTVAWFVHFGDGLVITYRKDNDIENMVVRLVRGGQPSAPPSPAAARPLAASILCVGPFDTLCTNFNVPETTPTGDFILDDVNGAAYHKETGLTWKRCAEGQTWDPTGKTCTGIVNYVDWPTALNLASGDWRLPSLTELHTIVEQRNWVPAINFTVFPNTPQAYFWSASPGADAGYAWSIQFAFGHNSADNARISIGNAVRLVRGEPWSGESGAGRVSATGGASFSVLNDVWGGAAYTAGLNASGQLGAGPASHTPQAQPQAFSGRSIYPVRVYWSLQRARQALVATTAKPLAATDTPNFVALASAGSHTIALRDDGTVWAWGDNAKGQLGDGSTNPADQPIPVVLDGSGAPLAGIIAIAAGREHSVAVKNDGAVWTWGSNAHGQLGDNSSATTMRTYPVRVLTETLLSLSGVGSVAASDVHTLALKTDGTVWAWGSNISGYLGTGDTNPRRIAVQVPGLTGVKAIGARGTDLSAHSLAQLGDGSLWGWGDNSYCQLGDTAAALGGNGNVFLTPVRLTNLSNLGVGLNHIASGDAHGIARTDGGAVWTWGDNRQGQLGDGTTTLRCAPIQVTDLDKVETVGAGADHSFATTDDGSVWGWGNNDQGQLGVGDTSPRLKPAQMSGENGVGFLDLKPDAATYLLMVAVNAAGTGSGSVSASGSYYAAGATVNLTATSATDSTFAGWSPSPCAASFPMPANALTCTATFTLATQPGDVNGDNRVDALDVVAVINAVLGIQPLPAADVNSDSAVNALDVVFVINRVLGIPL